MWRSFILVFILFQFIIPKFSMGTGKDSLSRSMALPDAQRKQVLFAGIGGLYAGSMAWLYTQWYSGYPQSGFHFFDDSGEWEGMDKVAHLWDTYSIAKPLARSISWSGYDRRRAALLGAGIAFMFQSTVEVLDGFSSEWGFSKYDMAANTLGAFAFLAQELTWEEQRIVLKYSFRRTPYADFRPELLGSTWPERILKDYNGMTFWASVNPASFMSRDFPRWLSVAAGIGAEGMTGGSSNPLEADGQVIPSFERYRQFYLGIDFDLARIRTKKKWLSRVFKVINIIRLPAPALELSPGRKTRFRALCF
jgi:hypothetical protein